MNKAVLKMLEKYKPVSVEDHKNALKEIIQEIALLGLFRSDFYSKAAFYGGSALRIFHDLDRFSEDLDFSLLKTDMNFKLTKYTKHIKDELEAFGFQVDLIEKKRSGITAIRSAFIKAETAVNLLQIKPGESFNTGIHRDEVMKIKLEIDTDPPENADFEVLYQLNPVPYSVRLYNLPSIFAGKLHALLCRNWKNRVKGRDFYDYVWFLSKDIKPNFKHLTARMRQTDHWNDPSDINMDALLELLTKKFNETDFEQAKRNVRPFLKDFKVIDVWSKEFFITVTQNHLSKW